MLILSLLTVALATSGRAAETGPALQVVGLDVRVEVDPDRGLLAETARVTLEGSSGPVIRLRLNRHLEVQDAKAGGGPARFSRAGDLLSVYLAEPMDQERLTLTFRIAGRPRDAGGNRIGRRIALLGGDDHWVPTLPAMAAPASLEILAPEGWTVLATGQPQEGGSGPGRKFRSGRPVRSLGFVAGEELHLTEAALGRTPFRVLAGAGTDAGTLAGLFSDPLTWLSGSVLPYPFEGLNLALVPGLDRPVHAAGFIAVPMDHPLRQPGDGAELLTPLWYGQHVAADGPWIQGLAAWQAMTYCRDRNEAMPSRLASQRDRYLTMYRNRDTAISRADGRTPEAVTRGKGSAAWEMIRLITGPRHFQARLSELVSGSAVEPLRFESVRERFIAGSPEPVDRVFSQWFDRTGLPSLTVELRTLPTSREEWRADLTIVQGSGPYTLPLDVVFHGAGREHRESIRIDEDTTRLLYVLPFQAIRVELDPLGRIFKQPTAMRNR